MTTDVDKSSGEKESPYSSLRVLGAADLRDALADLAHDPVGNVFVASRIEGALKHAWHLGGEVWGYGRGRDWSGLCYSGANLVPTAADEPAIAAFAERARRRGRRCSSIVGPAPQVLSLWGQLEDVWGAAREVRPVQPLMAISDDPAIKADPAVRPVREDELDILIPACIAMFTEEVGVSPVSGGDTALYRARVRELVTSGRAFVRIEDGQVIFKAELGSVSSLACQVQGVWVRPELRGTGLSAPGMAAVVQLARARFAPTVSLYVNDYNEAARQSYRTVGFHDVGNFATVLF
jgi:predicted GNAT family acetyltransferase